jgi:hypothetical protein
LQHCSKLKVRGRKWTMAHWVIFDSAQIWRSSSHRGTLYDRIHNRWAYPAVSVLLSQQPGTMLRTLIKLSIWKESREFRILCCCCCIHFSNCEPDRHSTLEIICPAILTSLDRSNREKRMSGHQVWLHSEMSASLASQLAKSSRRGCFGNRGCRQSFQNGI